jgi:hypothetical protein
MEVSMGDGNEMIPSGRPKKMWAGQEKNFGGKKSPGRPKKERKPAPYELMPDIPRVETLPERAVAMTDDVVAALRDVMNDKSQPGSARVTAAMQIKEIGYGKSSTDAPRLPDRTRGHDVTQRVLAMLTDDQLALLRAAEDAADERAEEEKAE